MLCKWIIPAAGAVLLTLLGACTRVTVPNSDPTPPSVQLYVASEQDSTVVREVTLVLGGADVAWTMARDEVLSLLATGTDSDGGVRLVKVLADVQQTCVRGGEARSAGPTTRVEQSVSNAGVGDSANTQRLVGMVIEIPPLRQCESGFQLTSARGTAWASAENFTQGSSAQTPRLTFQFQAP